MHAVILFGSKSWCLTLASLRILEGFHVRVARRMTGMMPKKRSDGSWEYPDLAEVPKAACLHTVCEYSQVWMHMVMKFMSVRPIYKFCREAERNWGSGSHLYWWNHPMELEETSAKAEAQADVSSGG